MILHSEENKGVEFTEWWQKKLEGRNWKAENGSGSDGNVAGPQDKQGKL
jgi:hypothetical protein